MPAITAMKPWSPVPCTVGAKRRLTARTPRSAYSSARFSPPAWRVRAVERGRSSSVAGRPGRRGDTRREQERPVGAGEHVGEGLDGGPLGRVGRRGVRKSCLLARWSTASAASAPARRRRGRRGRPQDVAPWPEGGRRGVGRASPVTSWPAASSSSTAADPIQPDAPVTKTRMVKLLQC